MLKRINYNFAVSLLLLIYGAMILFHFVIIIGAGIFDFIPLNIVWGGNLESKKQLLNFEIISLIVMVLCFWLTLIKANLLKIKYMYSLAHYFMWLAFAYFLLNTVGNLLAQTFFEKLFAIPAIMISVLSLRLALQKK